MNEQELMTVLLSPHVSEKSTMLAEKNNQFVFKVASTATRTDVKQAVELMFNVKVDAVQVLNVRGKVKYGKHPGSRASWKKAYVTLQEGSDIDFLTPENA